MTISGTLTIFLYLRGKPMGFHHTKPISGNGVENTQKIGKLMLYSQWISCLVIIKNDINDRPCSAKSALTDLLLYSDTPKKKGLLGKSRRLELGLSNRLDQVEFVLMPKLNELRNLWLKPSPFIIWIENLDLNPFIF